jgi:hypothetical protein
MEATANTILGYWSTYESSCARCFYPWLVVRYRLHDRALPASYVDVSALHESGRWESNPRPQLGMLLNKTLKAVELAALSFPSDSLNWKLNGNRTQIQIVTALDDGQDN